MGQNSAGFRVVPYDFNTFSPSMVGKPVWRLNQRYGPTCPKVFVCATSVHRGGTGPHWLAEKGMYKQSLGKVRHIACHDKRLKVLKNLELQVCFQTTWSEVAAQYNKPDFKPLSYTLRV